MKKLAILGSGNGSNFEAIANYFNGGKCFDLQESEQKRQARGECIDITCLSNVEDAYILTRAENAGIKNKFLPFKENLEYFKQNKFDLIVLAGYMKILSEEVLKEMGNVINIHPSLLPAFKGSTKAIKEAFLAGVKVSGVTVHWVTTDVDGGKIIAQYPVFITNDMHFDDFEKEIHSLEHKLYPIVIENILEDKVFEFSDLLRSKGSCSKGCSSCK